MNCSAKKNKNILNVYCTAGFPEADSTLKVMEALQHSGADMIELGMPYSDPLADGPVIQESGSKALEKRHEHAKIICRPGRDEKAHTVTRYTDGLYEPGDAIWI